MSHVIYGMLISNGRITMLENHAGQKQRKLPNHPTFVSYAHAVAINPVDLLCQPVTKIKKGEYIAAGDEVVFGKAGKETHGIRRFFSSLQIGDFKGRFGGAVSGHGWSFWKLSKSVDGVTNWTTIRFQTSLGCGSV